MTIYIISAARIEVNKEHDDSKTVATMGKFSLENQVEYFSDVMTSKRSWISRNQVNKEHTDSNTVATMGKFISENQVEYFSDVLTNERSWIF